MRDEGGFSFADFEDGKVEDAVTSSGESAGESATETSGEGAKPESNAQASVDAVQKPLENTAGQPVAMENPVVTSVAEPEESESDAGQMIEELKQQQKELELQQREFALQQKEFAEELKHENQKMIEETVTRTVDEKLSEYDLLPESSKEQVEDVEFAEELVQPEEIMPAIPAEESHFDSVAENDGSSFESDVELYDDDFTNVGFGDEFADEEVSMAESEEILAEEAKLDGIAPDESIINTETAADSQETVFADVSSFIDMENEAPVDDTPFAAVDDFIGETLAEPVSEPADYDDVKFLSVTDFCEEEAAAAVVEEAAAVKEEAAVEPEERFITADDMLDKIERILNDNDYAKSCQAELELFKRLRTLSNFLPEREKNSFDCCRMRMVIEYIISKMSGKPGLLITAESLIKSGVLGDEYNKQLEDSSDEELSNDLIQHVIKDMKKLAQGLEDKYLCTALCVSADGILEQIALRNQKCAIF